MGNKLPVLLIPLILIQLCVTGMPLFAASVSTEKNNHRKPILQSISGNGMDTARAVLIPIGGEPSEADNAALSKVLKAYRTTRSIRSIAPLTHFLEENPNSPWRAFVNILLGMVYRELGDTVKAAQSLEEALYLCESSRKSEAVSLGNFVLAAISDLAPPHERRKALEQVSLRAQARLSGASAQAGGWDTENRLTRVKKGTHISEFGYDGSGRRVEIIEKENGVVISDLKYLWDGEEIIEERDSTGAIVLRRFFDQGFTVGDTPYYYTRDHLGSIREVTDAQGTIRARYDYDPWGRPAKLSGDIDAPFLFAGYFWHEPSGLFLTKYRAYDPNYGRWLSRDPIGEKGGVNLYAYVDNDPINWTDTLGLSRDCDSEHINCFQKCWKYRPIWPINRRNKGWYLHCQTKCLDEYMDCVKSNKNCRNDLPWLYNLPRNHWWHPWDYPWLEDLPFFPIPAPVPSSCPCPAF